MYFEKGTVVFNSNHCPVTLYQSNGNKVEVKLPTEDGFVAEWKAILKPLQAGEEPTELLGQSARGSLALCLAEKESARTGKPVKIK